MIFDSSAVLALALATMVPLAAGHGLMDYPPSRMQLCGVEIKPHESAGTYCEDAFEDDFNGGYSFMSVLTHDIGRVGGPSTHVCGFDSETWYGGATPWDVATDAWPTFAIEPGMQDIWWNIEWGPHFDDTEEFRYWITKDDFVWDPTVELTWDDFEEEPFCVEFYDDANPTANPNVASDKDNTAFVTYCEIPTRLSGHHVIYGEWGRNHFTFERFHGCIDVAFGASTPTSPVSTPTDAPIASPTDAPVASPTDAPVASPTDMPVSAPTGPTPTDMPVASPTDMPVSSPTSSGECGMQWSDCYNDDNYCCDGMYCDRYEWYAQCQPVTGSNPTASPVAPVASPTPAPVAPVTSPTTAPVPAPTDAPVPAPTDAPVPAPTDAPVPAPTDAPVPAPTDMPVSSPTSECGMQWSDCYTDDNFCCDGYYCDRYEWHAQCQPVTGSNPTASPVAPVPSPTPAPVAPVASPTDAPVAPVSPTAAPIPVPTAPTSYSLLTTDNTLNAWEIYEGLASLTQDNNDSPATSALLASGGAAGSGSYVVSESQSYALLITGTVLASWDTHAGLVSGSDRDAVIEKFGRYFSFWQKTCQNSDHYGNCQSGGYICEDSTRGISSVCLPDWKSYADGSGSVGTGPAPDGDEDSIVGIILAVKAVENDASKPSWYEDARKWADASATAFFTYNVNHDTAGYKLVKLGACWGGWGDSGNNPSYHSPGSYKIMRDYQESFPDADRNGYSGISASDWNTLIATTYEVLAAVQGENGGAMVPNWATVDVSGGSIVHTGGSFSGSGTPQNEYGAEAARTTFRVALDATFYPSESSDWGDYLDPFLVKIADGYSSSYPYFSLDSFPDAAIPGTSLQVYMFNSWIWNGFIYGPTLSSLIVGDDQELVDAAGSLLSASLPDSYYPRCWVLISSLMMNGAMQSAASTFHA